MQLIGSLTSPFVRTTRAVCEELQADYVLEAVPFYAKMDSTQARTVNSSNPLMKVPVLIDGDQTIIDSRIIVKYLLEKYPQQKVLRVTPHIDVAEENRISVIYGLLDAGVLRFIMGKEGVSLEEGYLARSLERINEGLTYLNNDLDFGKSLGVSELMLVCCLEWFKKREIADWAGHAHLVTIHQKYSERDSFIKTRIPADA